MPSDFTVYQNNNFRRAQSINHVPCVHLATSVSSEIIGYTSLSEQTIGRLYTTNFSVSARRMRTF